MKASSTVADTRQSPRVPHLLLVFHESVIHGEIPPLRDLSFSCGRDTYMGNDAHMTQGRTGEHYQPRWAQRALCPNVLWREIPTCSEEQDSGVQKGEVGSSMLSPSTSTPHCAVLGRIPDILHASPALLERHNSYDEICVIDEKTETHGKPCHQATISLIESKKAVG